MKSRKKEQEKLQEYDDIFTKPKQLIRIVIHNKQPQFVNKRSWHKELDNLINPDQIKQGKFSPEEVEYIMGVVHKYQEEHNLTDQQLQDYIELKEFGLSKIWLTITKYIPTRTVDSVYKLIRRKLDSKNRQGYWRQDEVDQLLKYVQHYGRKWREISKLMHRTPDNIRNKYINLGQQNFLFRDKQYWTISEFITLMEHIQQQSGYQILKDDHEDTLNSQIGPTFLEERFRLNFRKMKEHDRKIFETLKEITKIPQDLGVTVKWTEIACEIKTKTKDDLRQMWFKLQGLKY